jgi:hypothetical protein
VSEQRLIADLEAARANLERVSYSDLAAWSAAYEKELDAERALAASRGHQYAEVIDIGVEWDTGAPLPHLVSKGGRASVLFYARAAGPSAADILGIVEFRLVASIRMGAPNDEAIDGHPLHGRGLRAYSSHEVHNSEWLQEHVRANSLHQYHSDEAWRSKHHDLLAFHDEMVECLTGEISVRTTREPFGTAFTDPARELLQPG